MRFRTLIDQVSLFSRIIQCVEKVSKKCLIRLSEENMEIICPGQNEDGIQLWTRIKVPTLFTEYRIQSNAGNIINAEMQSQALSHVLKGSVNAAEVVMKLAKKDDQAVFTFELQQMNQQGRRVTVVHHVRVTILRSAEVEKIKEPTCPDPEVNILFPSLVKLRTVAENQKKLCDAIRLSANHAGELMFQITMDDANVQTKWAKCVYPTTGDQNPQEDEPVDKEQHFGVLLSASSLLKCLNSHIVASNCIACICESHCLIMYVYIGELHDFDGLLTYYLPARLTGDDD